MHHYSVSNLTHFALHTHVFIHVNWCQSRKLSLASPSLYWVNQFGTTSHDHISIVSRWVSNAYVNRTWHGSRNGVVSSAANAVTVPADIWL